MDNYAMESNPIMLRAKHHIMRNAGTSVDIAMSRQPTSNNPPNLIYKPPIRSHSIKQMTNKNPTTTSISSNSTNSKSDYSSLVIKNYLSTSMNEGNLDIKITQQNSKAGSNTLEDGRDNISYSNQTYTPHKPRIINSRTKEFTQANTARIYNEDNLLSSKNPMISKDNINDKIRMPNLSLVKYPNTTSENSKKNISFIVNNQSGDSHQTSIPKSRCKNLFNSQTYVNKGKCPTSNISYIPRKLTSDTNNCTVNLEDLMILEDKLSEIMSNLNSGLPTNNQCYEWWMFYFSSSICGNMELYFKDEQSREVIKDCIKAQLLIMAICYDSSFNKKSLDLLVNLLRSIMAFVINSFILICGYILSKVSTESIQNIWVIRLSKIVTIKLDKQIVDNNEYYVNEIKQNNLAIYNYLRVVLKNYIDSEVKDRLIFYYKNHKSIDINQLNEFYRQKVVRVTNKNASVLGSHVDQDSTDSINIHYPYLKTEPIKPFTLVLDLDETLVHFKIDNTDDNKGLLRLRPGIYQFLNTVSDYYELIVFTAATQEYADPILDAIEQDRIYFDYRLYRQHATLINNDFVKDLSKLGRDIAKTIIVDNMPQNFRLQKENGIFIRTFYGEDPDDVALLDLIPILVSIARENRDVRLSLIRYKEEILKKISSNIARRDLNK